MSTKPFEEEPVLPTETSTEDELGGAGANLGTHGGSGADSGGTGAGTTALDSIGTQGNADFGVADHLKVKHKLGPKQ